MKIAALLGIIALLFSCKGLSQPENNAPITDTPELGENIDKLGQSVSRVFQDSKNNYWFTNSGAVKFDGETLTRFTTADGLCNNRIRDIQEDHLGNIYFDTGHGINKYDGKSIIKLKVIDDSVKAHMLLPTDLWFSGEWNLDGVYRCDGEFLYQLKPPRNPFEEEVREMNPNVSFSLYTNYTTFKDQNLNMWMGGSTFGACRYDGTHFTWISEREMTEIDPGPAMGVRTIVQDQEGNFYFGSNVNSKYRLYREPDGKMAYEKLPGIDTSEDAEASNSCISMIIDKNGNIWMSYYKGSVWKYDGEKGTHYPVLFRNEEAELFSIYEDRLGNIWLGTHNAGTFKFDGRTFKPFQPLTK